MASAERRSAWDAQNESQFFSLVFRVFSRPQEEQDDFVDPAVGSLGLVGHVASSPLGSPLSSSSTKVHIHQAPVVSAHQPQALGIVVMQNKREFDGEVAAFNEEDAEVMETFARVFLVLLLVVGEAL